MSQVAHLWTFRFIGYFFSLTRRKLKGVLTDTTDVMLISTGGRPNDSFNTEELEEKAN